MSLTPQPPVDPKSKGYKTYVIASCIYFFGALAALGVAFVAAILKTAGVF